MAKLTWSLERTLEAIKPFDGEPSFMTDIVNEKSPIPGYSARRLAHDVSELQRRGMLEVFMYAGKPECFDLTAEGRDYRHNRIVSIAAAVGKGVLELLIGASGGAVVWLLTRLAE